MAAQSETVTRLDLAPSCPQPPAAVLIDARGRRPGSRDTQGTMFLPCGMGWPALQSPSAPSRCAGAVFPNGSSGCRGSATVPGLGEGDARWARTGRSVSAAQR